MTPADQKQALVLVYNIIAGASVPVSLDAKFKTEVTKVKPTVESRWF